MGLCPDDGWWQAMTRKVILDTDIGGDIDDALALALLLNSPEIELRGITVCYRDVLRRAALACYQTQVWEKSGIPVAVGCEAPILGHWDPSHRALQADVIPKEFVFSPQPQHAVHFLIDQVMKSDEKITLCAIGPLTNIALALLIEPRISQKAELILMGGMIGETRPARPEWNILCDPEAAQIVFPSDIPLKMVGLDVTESCQFSQKHLDLIRDTGNIRTHFLHQLLLIFRQYFTFLPYLHDPLTAACCIWPDVLHFEKRQVQIETKGQYSRGMTLDCSSFFHDKPEGRRVEVAVSVRKDLFLERLMERILK